MTESRYSRQASLPSLKGCFNSVLTKSSVLVCGAGGLGCPAALYLAASGLGRLGIIDNDTVSLSNLNRQILYNSDDIGKCKAYATKEKLEIFNPDTRVTAYSELITEALLDSLLPLYDLVLDCTDNLPTRLIIAKCAYKLNKPSVVAGVRAFEGFILKVFGKESACLGCLYDQAVSSERPQILGAVAGTLGSMAAASAIQMLTGNQQQKYDMILLDLANFESTNIRLEKNPHCKICSGKY